MAELALNPPVTPWAEEVKEKKQTLKLSRCRGHSNNWGGVSWEGSLCEAERRASQMAGKGLIPPSPTWDWVHPVVQPLTLIK